MALGGPVPVETETPLRDMSFLTTGGQTLSAAQAQGHICLTVAGGPPSTSLSSMKSHLACGGGSQRRRQTPPAAQRGGHRGKGGGRPVGRLYLEDIPPD